MKTFIFLAIILLALLRPMPHVSQPVPLPVVLIRPASLDDALNLSRDYGFGVVDWTVVW